MARWTTTMATTKRRGGRAGRGARRSSCSSSDGGDGEKRSESKLVYRLAKEADALVLVPAQHTGEAVRVAHAAFPLIGGGLRKSASRFIVHAAMARPAGPVVM